MARLNLQWGRCWSKVRLMGWRQCARVERVVCLRGVSWVGLRCGCWVCAYEVWGRQRRCLRGIGGGGYGRCFGGCPMHTLHREYGAHGGLHMGRIDRIDRIMPATTSNVWRVPERGLEMQSQAGDTACFICT